MTLCRQIVRNSAVFFPISRSTLSSGSLGVNGRLVQFARPFSSSNNNRETAPWTGASDKIRNALRLSPSGYYCDMFPFGRGYAPLSPDKMALLKALEYKAIAGPAETETFLKSSLGAAKEQQEENRKIAPPFDYSKMGRLGRFLHYLFFGFPQEIFDSIEITPANTRGLKVDVEQIAEPHAVIASAQGRRRLMEDAHVAAQFSLKLGGVPQEVKLTGVFDGHGGAECAVFAAKQIENLLREYLEQLNAKSVTDEGIVNALVMTMVHLSQAYNPVNLSEKEYNPEAGSTANIVVEIGGDLWVANTGDSRAILVDSHGKAHQLSEDAKPGEYPYAQRIRERFGNVVPVFGQPRVMGRLSVGGAIGDDWSDGVVSARPAVTKFSGKDFDDFRNAVVIQCCDGVTDVATTEEIGARLLKERSAQDILEAAYACDSFDNLSVLVRPLSDPDCYLNLPL